MEVYTEKILVVDNEASTRHALITRLTLLGYQVICALDGVEALILFKEEQPDLVIIELLLPKRDGYEICFLIRETSNVPIIILTAIDDPANRIKCLELGADDYINKPFFPKELELRIRSILKRSAASPYKFSSQPNLLKAKKRKEVQIDSLNIDLDNRKLFKNNEYINLTVIEFNLLELLLENAGVPLSRILILDNVWGYTPERYVDTRIVDVNISRLRSKLETNPTKPTFILTVRGKGYLFRKY